jgi:hypothetical protein
MTSVREKKKYFMNYNFAVISVLATPVAAAVCGCEIVYLEEVCRLLKHMIILFINNVG